MDLIVEVMSKSKPTVSNPNIDQILDCTESVYKKFKNKCFSIQQAPEVAAHLSTLHGYCEQGFNAEVIKRAIIKICDE
ncbi:unnamed protein product [Heterobilharzia americana]|nr:unnamed protein product [Heterobilharzia americana]